MAICRICGAETDGDELCTECAENDRGGDVDGQLTLFGGEVGAAAVQTDSDTEADASDTGSASRTSGAINTADASRTTDAEDVFTSGTVDAFDSVDALKAFGAGNADIVGTQTDSTQISGAHPNSAHTDKTPSDGTQTGNTRDEAVAADDSASEPETVSLHPRDPNYDAVICLSGARPEAPRSIHAAPTKLLRAEHATAHSSDNAEHERDEQSRHTDADIQTDAEMHTDNNMRSDADMRTDAEKHTYIPSENDTAPIPTDKHSEAKASDTERVEPDAADETHTEEAVHAAEAVNTVTEEVTAVKEDIRSVEEMKFAYGKHRKVPPGAADINAAEDDAKPAGITHDSDANAADDESDVITAASDTDDRYGQTSDSPEMPYIPIFEDEYDDSEFLFPEPSRTPPMTAAERSRTDDAPSGSSNCLGEATEAQDNIASQADANTPPESVITQIETTTQAESPATQTATGDEPLGNIISHEDASDVQPLSSFELSGRFGSGLISSESEISLLLEYSPSDSIIEPDIADDETEGGADSADTAPEAGGKLISAIKSAGSGLRRTAAAAGKAFSAAAGWLKAHPIAAVGRAARCVGRGLRRAGKFLLGTPHHPLMFNRGDAEAYAASACVARIPLMFPIPLILHPRSRYARYSAACGAAVTLAAAIGVLADRLLCMLWRSVFTTTVNRGTSFEHVTLTSAGIQAITVTDTVFLTIMILFVAYSVFVAALGHRHPLAPRLLYRVAMIGEGRGSEKR